MKDVFFLVSSPPPSPSRPMCGYLTLLNLHTTCTDLDLVSKIYSNARHLSMLFHAKITSLCLHLPLMLLKSPALRCHIIWSISQDIELFSANTYHLYIRGMVIPLEYNLLNIIHYPKQIAEREF